MYCKVLANMGRPKWSGGGEKYWISLPFTGVMFFLGLFDCVNRAVMRRQNVKNCWYLSKESECFKNKEYAKDDTATLSVSVFKVGEGPTINTCAIWKSSNSGSYGYATEDALSAQFSITKAPRSCENSEALNQTDNLFGDGAYNNVGT